MRTNVFMNLVGIFLVSFVAISKAVTPTLSPRKGGKCKDTKGEFWIVSGFHAGNQRDCKWAKEKKWRCNSILEVRNNCPKTCDHCDSQKTSIHSTIPSTIPSTTPSTTQSTTPSFVLSTAPVKAPTCKDATRNFSAPSIGWLEGKVNCQWAAEKKDTRCEYEDIRDKCPILCNTCCRDKEGRFEISIHGRTESKTCDWVSRKDMWWRCKYIEAQEHCPNTCRVCKTRTNKPTITPTSSSSPTVCSDEPGWMTVDEAGNLSGKTCADIAENPKVWCPYLMPYTNAGITTFQACCVCGKSDSSLAPSITHSHSPSMHPSVTPSPTIVGSESPSAAPTQCIDEPEWIWDENMNYGCADMSKSFCDSFSSHWVNGKNSNSSCCVCGGGIHVPAVPSTFPSTSTSPSLSLVPSLIPTSGPTTVPTVEPTKSSQPSPSPTSSPSIDPSSSPSDEPSTTPTYLPSSVPSIPPTTIPTTGPSHYPSNLPSTHPSLTPSSVPSIPPTTIPTTGPSHYPSYLPSTHPSLTPTFLESSVPSAQPSICLNERGWVAKSTDPVLDSMDSNCEAIEASNDPLMWCSIFDVEYGGKSTYEACCICGGGNHHNVAPSSTPTFNKISPEICVDEPNWKWKDTKKGKKYCKDFPSAYCDSYDKLYFDGKNPKAACCVCGGGTHMPKNEP